MGSTPHLTILGAGPAGLSAAYHARTRDIPFTVYEKTDRLGGNCTTFSRDGFRYDAGAHRFHDVDPDITALVRNLLGDDLLHVDAPSQIRIDNGFIDFPLAPLNLLQNLGPRFALKGGFDLLRARIRRGAPDTSFEDVAIARYGQTIARHLLLNYSEKLWGLPCTRLAPATSGRRLQGLNFSTFAIELLRGSRRRRAHLDGSFYYPRHGYGMIADRLADAAGRNHIVTGTDITRIKHDKGRVQAIATDGGRRIEVDHVISTLPLSTMLTMLHPAPPASMTDLAAKLTFRHVVLVALFLDRPQVTPNATIYFPDATTPFTRVYEPRNRSRDMAPPGKTSLVAEIPCNANSPAWAASDADLLEQVLQPLMTLQWFDRSQLFGHEIRRLPFAYPVLDLAYGEQAGRLLEYLQGFDNLQVIGRSGLFSYVHLHDVMKSGKEAVDKVNTH